jgi:hypothetical protein
MAGQLEGQIKNEMGLIQNFIKQTAKKMGEIQDAKAQMMAQGGMPPQAPAAPAPAPMPQQPTPLPAAA